MPSAVYARSTSAAVLRLAQNLETRHGLRSEIGATVAVVLVTLLWFSPATSALEKGLQDPPAPPTSTTGTVEGQVTYKSDPQRPWRYGRYYIKYPSRGHLAEAVVALRGSSLKSSSTAPGSPKQPQTAQIDQKDFRFVPETLAIQVHDRVRFSNSDIQVHNVKSYDGPQPFNVNTPTGGEYVHTFSSPTGTKRPIRIGCSFHSQMQAWVFVFPHRYFHVTGEDGKFRITGIPPGEYDLELTHAAGELQSAQRIRIVAGEVTTVNYQLSPDQRVESKP